MNSDDSCSAIAGSVTRLIQQLQGDGQQATGELWRRYFERLLPVARARLRALPNPAVDEEDVLLSVFDRFFRAALEGRFAELKDRNDLWQILLMLIEREVANQYRHARARKRGGGEVNIAAEAAPPALAPVQSVPDQQPGPELVTIFNDCLGAVVQRLGDPHTRDIALLRLEGYTNQEIAHRLNLSLASVERKLRLIREVWRSEFS